MPHIPHDLENFWHDHAGARWLIPMIALLALVIGGLVLMLIYPYVSA